MRYQRVLVTGGTGFLGAAVCNLLHANGATVIPLGQRDGDLTDEWTIQREITETRPDAVIHLAALCGGIGANRDAPASFLTDNALMGLYVLRACAEEGIKVVMLGSVCAYPKHTHVPFVEAALWDGYPEETNAPYGIAKRMLLVAAQAYRAQYGLNAVTVIPVNLYGPCDHFEGEGGHVIPAMIRKFDDARRAGADSVTLWGDGTPTREFLYVEDAAEGVCLALERLEDGEPVNLGTGEEIFISELAYMVAETVGFKGAIHWDTSKPNGQPRRRLDVTRAAERLGFKAHVKLEDGLRRTVAWYKSSRIGLDVPPEEIGGGEG